MKMMVTSAGTPPQEATATYLAQIAKSIGAELLVFRITIGPQPGPQGKEAIARLKSAGEAFGLSVKVLIRQGPIVDAIIEMAKREKPNLIVMGIGSGKVINEWIAGEVIHHGEYPVVMLPHPRI